MIPTSSEQIYRTTIPYVVIVLLTAGTVFAYWSVKDHGFSLYDDVPYVVNNYYVQPGITGENLLWAMTSGYEGNWQPVTWVSHMLDVQLFGTDNPAGHHLHNVLIHLLNSIVLYLLMRRMTGREGVSAFVAFVFALHPLHVESVAWVCQRKDLLSALFGFLAIFAYSRYVDAPRVSRYLVVVLCFALGLMAKSIIITLPFVLLLLDYWPLNRMGRIGRIGRIGRMGRMTLSQPADDRRRPLGYLVVEKIPLLVLSVGVSIVTYIVQKEQGAIVANLPIEARVVNALVSYGVYLKKTFLPTDLAIFYPHPITWSLGVVILSGAVIAAVTIVAVVKVKRLPWFAVGWFWFLGTLVPMIGLIQIGGKAYADRYMYFPIVGLSIVVAWFVAELGKPSRVVLLAKAGAAVLACLVLTVSTIRYVKYWESDTTLFARALEVTKERNWLAHYMLGIYAKRSGDTTAAREHFEQSLSYPYAHFQLGRLMLREGKAEEAITYFEHALHNNVEVGQTRMSLGVAFAAVGRLEEALEQFSEASSLNPHYGEPLKNLALALVRFEQYDEAERFFIEAQRAAPHDPEVADDIERVRRLKSSKNAP